MQVQQTLAEVMPFRQTPRQQMIASSTTMMANLETAVDSGESDADVKNSVDEQFGGIPLQSP